MEEADESSFWMELLIESGIMPESKLKSLYEESVELTKVFAVTRETSNLNKVKKKNISKDSNI